MKAVSIFVRAQEIGHTTKLNIIGGGRQGKPTWQHFEDYHNPALNIEGRPASFTKAFTTMKQEGRDGKGLILQHSESSTAEGRAKALGDLAAFIRDQLDVYINWSQEGTRAAPAVAAGIVRPRPPPVRITRPLPAPDPLLFMLDMDACTLMLRLWDDGWMPTYGAHNNAKQQSRWAARVVFVKPNGKKDYRRAFSDNPVEALVEAMRSIPKDARPFRQAAHTPRAVR